MKPSSVAFSTLARGHTNGFLMKDPWAYYRMFAGHVFLGAPIQTIS